MFTVFTVYCNNLRDKLLFVSLLYKKTNQFIVDPSSVIWLQNQFVFRNSQEFAHTATQLIPRPIQGGLDEIYLRGFIICTSR